MNSLKVKICGITNSDDARAAASYGADALGFIFVPSSPRCITAEAAKDIIRTLPPFISKVGVFAGLPRNEILSIIDQTGIDCVQLHGNETAEECAGFPVPVIKSFRVGPDFQSDQMTGFSPSAFLLDTLVGGKIGGTGKTFDWDIAVAAKRHGRIILAGGLSPENIADAVKKVQPYAVDINSGVERAPGRKDYEKLRLLFEKLRQLDRNV